MLDTWDSLPQRHRGARVAMKVMRWHVYNNAFGTPCWYTKGHVFRCRVSDYRPTANIAQAWEVQEQIQHLNLTTLWAIYLGRLLPIGPTRSPLSISFEVVWRIASANADQRCHAAVLAVGEADDH